MLAPDWRDSGLRATQRRWLGAKTSCTAGGQNQNSPSQPVINDVYDEPIDHTLEGGTTGKFKEQFVHPFFDPPCQPPWSRRLLRGGFCFFFLPRGTKKSNPPFPFFASSGPGSRGPSRGKKPRRSSDGEVIDGCFNWNKNFDPLRLVPEKPPLGRVVTFNI